MKNIVIIGAGELGKEVVWLIEDINKREPQYLILGYLDDLNEKGSVIGGYRVLGGTDDLEMLYEKNRFSAVIAVQEGNSRKKLADKYPEYTDWETLIHPTAVIAPGVELGEGSIVFPQVTLSINSKMGKHGLFYIHSTVCNDCLFGDYVSVMTGVTVSEHVTIGDETYLAAGCNVYPNVMIGKQSRAAVGVTVSENFGDGVEIGKKDRGLFFK